jgi:hypothetical protein
MGKGFKGLVQYQFKETREKAARMLDTNMGTDDAKEMIKSLADVSQQRPRVAKPVLHIIAAWHERDEVSDETMKEVSRRLLDRLGMSEDNHQYLLVRHEDTKHPHMHIVANRVGLDGSVMAPEFCGRKVRDEATKIDIEHGFTSPQKAVSAAARRGERIPEGMRLSPPSRDGNEQISLTKMNEREGMRSAKHQVFTRVKEALLTCDGTLENLDEEVRKRGVSPDWSFNKEGRFNGASFTLMNADGTEPLRHGEGEEGEFVGNTYTFKGSQLGPKPGLSRDYIEKALQARSDAIDRQESRASVKSERAATRKANQEARRRAFADLAQSSKERRTIVGSRVGNTRRRYRAYHQRGHSSVLSLLRLLTTQHVPTFKLPSGPPTLRPPRLR